MTIIASNSITLSNVLDGTGIANVTNFYLASNQSTGIKKPAEIVNLIRNGAYPTNTNYWSGAMIVSQHGFYYNGQKKLFLLATTGPSEITASSYRFEVKRNTNYSLSFYALAGGNVKSSDVFFLGRKSNETNDFTSANLIIGKRRFSGSKAEYVTITFNSGDNDNGYIRFDNNGSSDGINAVLFFGEVMLVEGREPKPWVAAIEDSGWTRIPQQTTYANRFLWNYRIELYSDGVTKSIEPTVIGVYGEKGDPGKVVSNTEPTTRFKGLTWKYIGTSDLTASDGTVIHPNTEYYYNGTHWMINYFSVNNFESESITSDKINGKNLTITDGEFISKTSNGPVTTSTEIKDNHIAISKTDGTVNTKNDIALDSEQGFAMRFVNNSTNFTKDVAVNSQGFSISDSDGNFAQLTPQGTKLSTDVPWTDITRASGVGTSGTLRARINNGVFYAQSKDVTIPSIAPNSLITIGTMSSKFSGVSGFDTLGLLYSPGQLSVASVTVGNDGKINIGNPNPTTMSGKVIQFSINIPLG